MENLAIRCRPNAPVSADELERWLAQQIDDFHVDLPESRVRLWHLTSCLPSGDVDTGWLLELELPGSDPSLARQRLADLLRDLRLLGLRPALLGPRDLPDGEMCQEGAGVAAHATSALDDSGS